MLIEAIYRVMWRRMAGFFLGAFVLIGVAGVATGQAPGHIDTNFNAGGSGGFGTVVPVHAYPDGRILAQGVFTTYNGLTRNHIVRLKPDGKLDESFNIGSGAQNYALNGVSVLPDGRILAFGSFTYFADKYRPGLVRLDENGALDATFDPELGNPSITNIALQPDGKLLAAGLFSIPGDPIHRRLVRLHPDGTFDRSFEASLLNTSEINALAIQSDGKILVGGNIREAESGRFTFFRLQRDGSLDGDFNPPIRFGTFGWVQAIAVQPNGKILVAGSKFIRRFERGGAEDTTFQTTATASYSSPTSILLQPDGKILLAGAISDSAAYTQLGYARLNPDGTRDTGFDVGMEERPSVSGMVMTQDGTIFVSGPTSPRRVFGGEPTVARAGTARIDSSSYLVNESQPAAIVAIVREGGNSETLSVNYSTSAATASAADDFAEVSGTVTFNPGEIWKLVAVPLTQERVFEGDETFTFQITAPDAEPASTTVTIVDDDQPGRVEWRRSPVRITEDGAKATLQITRNGETSGAITVRFSTMDSSAIAGDDYASKTDVVTMEDGENVKTVEIPVHEDQISEGAEAFTVMLSEPGNGSVLGKATTATVIIADNASPGSVLPSFTKGSADSISLFIPSWIRCSAELPSGKLLIGGRFDSYAGVTRRALVLLNSEGTVNESFPALLPATAEVAQILPLADGKVLLRGTNLRSGTTVRTDLIRLNADASLDDTFNPGIPNGTLNVLTLQPDGKLLVAGGFSAIGGGPRTNFARLMPNGALDTSFTVSFAPSSTTAVAVQPDGRIVYGGEFATARLHPNGEPDTEFIRDPAFSPFFARVQSLVIQPDGYILAGGEFGFVDRPTATLVRLQSNGALDPTFTMPERFKEYSDTVNSIWLQGDGSILISGVFTNGGAIARSGVLQLFADGTVNPTFAARIDSYALAVLANGNLLVSATVDGEPQLNQLIGGHLKLAGDSRVHFTWSKVNVSEGAGEAIVSVMREGGNLSAATVDVRTENGTAKVGADYEAVETSISFAAHELTKQVRIPVIDNVSTQGSRSFTVELSNLSTGATLGSRTTTTVTVEDNELPGRFELESPTLTTRESSTTLMVRVKRFLGADGRVTVDLKTTEGSATVGADFGAVATTLVFEPGVTEQLVPIPIMKDGLTEGNETFSVALSNATAGSVLSTAAGATSADVTLVDIDDPGSLKEGFAPDFELNAAIDGAVFQADGKLLIAGRFKPSIGAQGRLVRLLPNGTPDPAFTSPTLDSGGNFSIVVQPDGKIIVAGGFSRVNNVQRQSIARLNPDGTLDTSFVPPAVRNEWAIRTVGLQSDGKIVIGGSFTTVNFQSQPYLARLQANGAWDSTYRPTVDGGQSGIRRILITPEDKVLYVNVEHRLHQLLPDGTVDPEFNSAIRLSSPIIYCIEMDLRGRVVIGGYFSRAGSELRKNILRLLPDGSLDTSFNAGELFNSAPDAIAIQADEKIIAAGYVQSLTQRPIVRLLPNGDLDEHFRTEDTRIPDHVSGTQVSPNGTVLVRGINRLDAVPIPDIGLLLLGPQPGAFRFGNALAQVSENEGTVSLTVERTGGSDGEVKVAYYTEVGTAQPGADYTAVAGELVFPAGVMTGTITIPIVNDNTWDPSETFTVRLGNVTEGAVVLPGKDKATVTITNDDPPLRGTLQFAQTELTVAEGAGSVTLVVERVGGSDDSTNVEYRALDGLAKAGFDFTAKVGTLRFAHGETTKEIQISLFDNLLREASEFFTVELTSLEGAPVGSTGVATVTITDSDMATIDAFGGTYRGLVHRDDSVGGSVVVSLLRKGSTTATVLLDGQRYRFRGKFDAAGIFTATITAKDGSPVTLRLRADEPGTAPGHISGTVEIGGVLHELTADEAPYNSLTNPAPMTGRYTCVFQAAENDEDAPRGIGFGNVTVAKNGSVRLVGTLADGTKISQSTNLASGGSWGLFLPLYDTGGLSGTAQFSEIAQTWDFSGSAFWAKPERPKDRFYSSGFFTQLEIIGSPMPAKGSDLLDFDDGRVSLSDGGVVLERDLTIVGGRQISLARGVEKLQLSLNRTSGIVTGSFIPPGSRSAVTIRGIVLPDENRARGFFLGEEGSGEFRLEQRVPPAS